MKFKFKVLMKKVLIFYHKNKMNNKIQMKFIKIYFYQLLKIKLDLIGFIDKNNR